MPYRSGFVKGIKQPILYLNMVDSIRLFNLINSIRLINQVIQSG